MEPLEWVADLNKEHSRLQTFYSDSFWENTDIDICELAWCGFYYEEKSGRVTCYFCGLQLTASWHGRQVFKEHFLQSPQCSFLLQTDTSNEPIDEGQLELELTLLKSEVSDFHMESERLKSFSWYRPWPAVEIDPAHLAMLGFVYTGLEDTVQCYFCKVKISDWKMSDCVVDRHFKDSPLCPFLNRTVNSNIAIDEARLRKEISSRESYEEDADEQQSYELAFGEALLELFSEVSPTAKKGESTEDKDKEVCKICLEAKYDAVFLPCGHVATCMDCGSKLKNCCICRSPIQLVRRVFFS